MDGAQLVLIWSTSEGWKAELTLEVPSGFEPRTPGLGIQRLNHWAAGRLGLAISFLYGQTLFNFRNIHLEQHIHFVHNPLFIHPHSFTKYLRLTLVFMWNKHASFHLWWKKNLVKHQNVSDCTYTKWHSSFRTNKQNKSLLVSKNCGYLILLAQKN